MAQPLPSTSVSRRAASRSQHKPPRRTARWLALATATLLHASTSLRAEGPPPPSTPTNEAAVVGELQAAPSAVSGPMRNKIDPKLCQVVIEEIPRVGYRIADGQAVAEAIAVHFKKRLGKDAVIYAGVAKSQRQLQQMLGSAVETPAMQAEQLAYFAAAEQHAPFRISARFGTQGKGKNAMNFVEVSCRRTDADKNAPPLDTKRVEAKRFIDSRDALSAALPGFCLAIAAPTVAPTSGSEPLGMRKRTPKPFTPPPPR